MDSNQFTIKTQEVIQAAQELAQAEGHQAIENAHLLKGIFIKDHDVVPYILKQSNVNPKTIELALDRILETQSKVSGAQLYLSPKAQETLQSELKAAKQYGAEYATVERRFLAEIDAKDQIGQQLRDAKLDKKTETKHIMELRNGEKITTNQQ